MEITPETIKALATLRKLTHTVEVQSAIAKLDQAGVFAAIDDAGRCTCTDAVRDRMRGGHAVVCPAGYARI